MSITINGIGFNLKLINTEFLRLLSMMKVELVRRKVFHREEKNRKRSGFSAQIPSYVVSSWKINALLVGDTRRLTDDIFQPFLGYMSDLIFNDEHLFSILTTTKVSSQRSSFRPNIHHILIGYRIAFFNLLTIETQTSYIAFSERENQQKNVGKFDIYFLFRTLMPDGIILYRYAQGLNEYFAIGLRAGILTLFVDFGFGKRQILSDESMKLADGKWHEVRVTRLGLDK